MSTDVYVTVLRFYADQMAFLDALDLDAYAGTFTEDGVTHHVHRDHKLEGRAALLAHAREALPRYREVSVRHWNDNYRMDLADDGSLTVTYGSLVTLTDKEGQVRIESTYAVTDLLVRVEGRLRVRSRTILRDRAAAG
ncbi:nuclear transport factor 2 family protein [Streptomyces sp. NPDC057148]|uniref:nuclear transport factor 2 family protein n=1 Tax=Streptomyces sp. NPDC057148 TaxID=3346035 RepID=UPI00363A50D6